MSRPLVYLAPIQVRLTDEQVAALDAARQETGESRTEFVRAATVERAGRIVAAPRAVPKPGRKP